MIEHVEQLQAAFDGALLGFLWRAVDAGVPAEGLVIDTRPVVDAAVKQATMRVGPDGTPIATALAVADGERLSVHWMWFGLSGYGLGPDATWDEAVGLGMDSSAWIESGDSGGDSGHSGS